MPKCKDGLESINNWRLLTISSIVLRLYTNLIAQRELTVFKLIERQRGFIKAAGCAENGFLTEKIAVKKYMEFSSRMLEHKSLNIQSIRRKMPGKESYNVVFAACILLNETPPKMEK